jgi:hypothetical protein
LFGDHGWPITVWPITVASLTWPESGKSMKGGELALSREG